MKAECADFEWFCDMDTGWRIRIRGSYAETVAEGIREVDISRRI